jgi:hypothetical protein
MMGVAPQHYRRRQPRTTCSDSSSTYIPTTTLSMDYYDIRFCASQNNSSNYNFTTLCTFDDPSNCTSEVDYTVPSFNVMDHYYTDDTSTSTTSNSGTNTEHQCQFDSIRDSLFLILTTIDESELPTLIVLSNHTLHEIEEYQVVQTNWVAQYILTG